MNRTRIVAALATLAFAGWGEKKVAAPPVAPASTPSSAPYPTPTPEPATPALVADVRAHCNTQPCEAAEAAAFVASILPEWCEGTSFECSVARVLEPAARRMTGCRRDCGCPRLARALVDAALERMEDLEDAEGGVASCPGPEDCVQQAGMLAPPAIERGYCG